jgi:O-antigen/teichoic acid export membrane protein
MVSASMWSMGSLAVAQLARLASNLVLARLLAPADFGVVAIVSSVLAGLQMFSDIGIVPSIVRSTRGEEPIFLDTAFTLQAARGFSLLLAACIAAWPISLMYGSGLLYLMPAAGITAALNGLASSRVAIAARHMDQRRLTYFELATFMIQLGTTMAWAVYSPSAWAIVGGWIAGSASRVLLSHTYMGHWQDRFRLDRESARELLAFGRWVFISTVIAFFALQIDRLLLGKLMDLPTVGLYSIALSLVALPRELVNRVASAIQFAALSRCARESPRHFEALLLKSRRVLVILALWMILAIAYYAQAFFAMLYDSRYQGASEIVRYLTVPVFINTVSQASAFGLLAMGDSKALARADVVRVVTMIPTCIVGGLYFGLPGFIAGLAISALAGYLFQAHSLRSHKVHTLAPDLAIFLLFLALLAVPFATSSWSGWAGFYRGVDLGSLAICTVILIPLTVAAGIQIRALLNNRRAPSDHGVQG